MGSLYRVADTVKGGYNLVRGLANWKQGRAYAKGNRALAGNLGVDVVWLGDSISGGSGSSFIHTDKVGNRLRQLLQYELNPVDLKNGGFGFFPIMSMPPTIEHIWQNFGNGGMRTNGVGATWAGYGFTSYTGEAGQSKGICTRHMRSSSSLAGPSQSCAWLYVAGMQFQTEYQVSAAAQIIAQKQAQIVYSTNVGDGVFRWGWGDFNGGVIPYSDGAGGYPTYATHVDVNAYEEDVDCDAAEAVGLRSGMADVMVKTASTHWIQIDQKEANNAINIEGVILYNDDYDIGCRFHDLSNGGALSSDYNNAVTLAGLGRFGTGQDKSRNCKLVIINLLTNDCGFDASPVTSLSTYESNLTTLITSIQGWASKPSILFWVPPCSNDADAQGRYRDYISVVKNLCRTYNCALLDFWAKIDDVAHGAGSAGGYMFDRGFYFDGIHYNDKGNDWFARDIFEVIR